MSDYIDFKVVGQVIGIGLVLGAGLPLVFAVGLRALSSGTGDSTTGADSATGFRLTGNAGALLVGVVCLVVVVGAVLFGIHTIMNKS